MCFIAFRSAETPILTTGDAIALFILEPDASSANRCLLARRVRALLAFVRMSVLIARKKTYDERPRRWGSALSWRW